MKKRKRAGIFWKLALVLAVIIAIFFCGYLFLDKIIVPKYFEKYGINEVPDLVGVVTSLYKSPKEKNLVTNGHTQSDLNSAIKSLQDAGYNIDDDGSIPQDEKFTGKGKVGLTDREFGAVCEKLLNDGILLSVLPTYKYIDLINISLLEVTVTPDKSKPTENGDGYTSATIEFIIKIETDGIREQIANQMGTPLFLLNLIIPDTLYFEVSYDIDVTEQGTKQSNGSIAINGRTTKQSEILINLLIDFIFPEDEKMNLEGFTLTLGDIITQGIDLLQNNESAENNNFMFSDKLGLMKNQNGMIVQ